MTTMRTKDTKPRRARRAPKAQRVAHSPTLLNIIDRAQEQARIAGALYGLTIDEPPSGDNAKCLIAVMRVILDSHRKVLREISDDLDDRRTEIEGPPLGRELASRVQRQRRAAKLRRARS